MMSENEVRYTLSKEERLHAQKQIDLLFQKGKSFIAYPLRIVYIMREKDGTDNQLSPSVSIFVSVPKKKLKRAVKRNRVKRLIKEAYRLHKNGFINAIDSKTIEIAFLYLKDELPEYIEIEKAMLKTFSILSEKITSEDGV